MNTESYKTIHNEFLTMNNLQGQKEFKFKNLWYDILKHRRLYYIVLPIAFVLSCIYYLSIPNIYTSTVVLSPEMSSSLRYNSIKAIANSFKSLIGDLDFDNKGEAINPTVYPILMNSVEFKASLLPIKFKLDNSDKELSYYDYLLNYQKRPWWSGLFGNKVRPEPFNTFRPNKIQDDLVKALDDIVTCEIDKKTLVITITVSDTDPYVCAIIADSVKVRLQQFITNYRTNKSRIDLNYNIKVCKEAHERYEKARLAYSTFSDANKDANLKSVLLQQEYLEGEMDLQNKVYSQLFRDVQKSEAEVQKKVPAFTTLQSATVPVEKSAPVRSKKVLVFVGIVTFLLTLYVFHKEGDLIPLLLYEAK